MGVEEVADRWQKISVYSPSMDKVIINDVFRASGRASAPTFHLLNDIDGGVDNKGWFGLTDNAEYFGNKPVNVLDCVQRFADAGQGRRCANHFRRSL